MTAGGLATAVWTDSDGVWTADRSATGKWGPSQLLLPGASAPLFTMNERGDAAIAWTMGGPPGNSSSVLAVLRPAGRNWTSPQTLASGTFVIADHVGIGEDGGAIVTWETYQEICRYGECFQNHFSLHTSRNNGPGWVRTGVLLGPDANSHIARVVIDAGGGAMLVVLNSSGAYVSATQPPAGNTWSTFNTAVFVNGLSMVSELASDRDGNVTMVYETIGLTTSQAFYVDGSIGHNAWSSPVLLSGGDTNVRQIYFAVATNGTSVAAWLSSSGTPAIHAAIRTSSTIPWSVPVTISAPGSTEISPEAAAVSTSGSAIVVYSGYNQSSVHTEYAVNYTP